MSSGEEKNIKKSKIEFILKNPDEDISGCTLVAGFYGLGRVGFISVNHIVQKLDAKLIGYLVSEFIPPFLSIKNNRIVLPFEIYRHEDVIFLTTYFEPYKYEHRSFAESIIHWAKDNNISQSILLGGLDSRLRTEEDIFAKAVCTTRYRNEFQEPTIPFVDDGLYISGPMALMLMYAEIYNFPAIGILPYAERSRPDPIAASHAVETVNDLLKIDCGVEELILEAETIETELQELEGLRNEEDTERTPDRGMFM